MLRVPEFFRQLVFGLHCKPRIHSVDSFVQNEPTGTNMSVDGRLELTDSELTMKLRRRVKSSRKTHSRMNNRPLVNLKIPIVGSF